MVIYIMEKTKVKLSICGSDYILTSEESESYIRSVGEIVDKKMNDILSKNSKISVSMASVLSSLEFCDESLKSKEKIENLEGQIKRFTEENSKFYEIYKVAEKENSMLNEKINDLQLKLNESYAEISRLKEDKKTQLEQIKPEEDIITFSLLENEIAVD